MNLLVPFASPCAESPTYWSAYRMMQHGVRAAAPQMLHDSLVLLCCLPERCIFIRERPRREREKESKSHVNGTVCQREHIIFSYDGSCAYTDPTSTSFLTNILKQLLWGSLYELFVELFIYISQSVGGNYNIWSYIWIYDILPYNMHTYWINLKIIILIFWSKAGKTMTVDISQ